MAAELIDRKITQEEADRMVAPMELDLTALFKVMEQDMIETIEEYEGNSVDELIDQILNKLAPDPNQEVQKVLSFNPVFKAAYKLQGKKVIQGLPISIENRKGSIRKGTDDNGHEWKIKMTMPYGYIRLTEGTDGDHVDVYIGDNEKSEKVFIIHQNNPDTGKYDEDKVMIGFDSAAEAKKAYLRQYDRPGFFGSMQEISMDEFKVLLKKKKGKKLQKSMNELVGIATQYLKGLKDRY